MWVERGGFRMWVVMELLLGICGGGIWGYDCVFWCGDGR